MTKSKKRTSRFYVEQDSLYETSDLGSSLNKKQRQRHTKAIAAEETSRQKIVAINAPVEAVLNNEDEAPATDLRESWMDE